LGAGLGLRLLHVVSTYLPAVRYGGPIVVVHGLCRALARRGHDVTVYTTSIDGPTDSPVPLETPVEIDGVKVVYHRSPFARRLAFAPGLWRRLRSEVAGFDLVHLHALFEWPVQAAARAARRAGVPYLMATHGMLVPELVLRKSYWAKAAWLIAEQSNLRAAAGLHVTTHLEERELRRMPLDLPRAFVVPYGIDLPEAASTPAAHSERASPRLLFLGRVNWKKGLDRLLAALPEVPLARLVIAGNDENGYERQLRAMADRYGVASRVDFRGPVYGAAKQLLLEQADLFVLPSYSENFGNAVLEAMAAGLPVVVTPDVGLAESIEAAGAGVVTDASPARLAATLRELLADPQRLREMGRRGCRLVRQRFSWDSVAVRMEEVMRQLLARPRT
jgi:glycosyltransferase involved in cell wall biosynthesis